MLRVYRGTTPAGKRLYFNELFKGSSEDADKRLNQILTDISNGIEPSRALPEKPAELPTVSDALDRWLKHQANGRKARPRTIANYEWMFDAYVKPTLGDKRIGEIGESHIQELYAKLLEGPAEGREGSKVGAKTLRNL